MLKLVPYINIEFNLECFEQYVHRETIANLGSTSIYEARDAICSLKLHRSKSFERMEAITIYVLYNKCKHR